MKVDEGASSRSLKYRSASSGCDTDSSSTGGGTSGGSSSERYFRRGRYSTWSQLDTFGATGAIAAWQLPCLGRRTQSVSAGVGVANALLALKPHVTSRRPP